MERKSKSLIGKKINLSKSILSSNKKKIEKNDGGLELMDETIKELEAIGAVERVSNLNKFMEENPTCSFLAHIPIVKLDRQTTKCRMVHLSNLAERNKENPNAISHNTSYLLLFFF